MSDAIYASTVTVYASQNGSAKWLLGAAMAALAISSGYLVWKNNAPDVTLAAYDPPALEPLRASPLPPSEELLAARAAEAERAAAERAAAEARARRAARRTAETASSEPIVLEETIGAAETDEIVVTRARRPVWARTPNARRLSALYPARARERGREGEASLACIIQVGGALACERVSATPGFGAAALRVARMFRHAPTLADGRDAAGVQLNLRVVFRMEEEERRRG